MYSTELYVEREWQHTAALAPGDTTMHVTNYESQEVQDLDSSLLGPGPRSCERGISNQSLAQSSSEEFIWQSC